MNHTIIEEVREARAAIAEEHGFDVQRIHEWAKKSQQRERHLRSNLNQLDGRFKLPSHKLQAIRISRTAK